MTAPSDSPESLRHSPPLTRRATLGRLGAGALLSLGLWPGCAHVSTRRSEASFRFLVINDTHFMSPECGSWLERVVAQMNGHEEVRFCLIAGDLTEQGQRDHLGAVRDIFQGLKAPTRVVIGNHDYGPGDDRRAYDAVYPGQINYSFGHEGWQFIGLDTSDGLRYEKTRIQPATLHWADTQLAGLDPRRPTVIFTHFPLGAGVTYRPLNADALLERFLDFNLQAVFSGHFHGFTETKSGAAVLTTNRCCALKRGNHDKSREKGYFLCTASQGRIIREFVEVRPDIGNHAMCGTDPFGFKGVSPTHCTV